MKYALLVYVAPDAMDGVDEAEAAEINRQYWAVREDPRCYDGAHLQGAETASTVRVPNGRPLITDGPFAETKEVFGGYYLVESDDIDGALELAAKVPATWMGGSVEVRPVVEM